MEGRDLVGEAEAGRCEGDGRCCAGGLLLLPPLLQLLLRSMVLVVGPMPTQPLTGDSAVLPPLPWPVPPARGVSCCLGQMKRQCFVLQIPR